MPSIDCNAFECFCVSLEKNNCRSIFEGESAVMAKLDSPYGLDNRN